MPTILLSNRFVVVILSFTLAVGSARAATNSWKVGSDFWDSSGVWSLGLPDISQGGAVITNAGNKTVTIDASTAAFSPSTMTVSNLIVSGAGNTTNTLFLDNAGTNTPLLILRDLSIANGGVLRIANSSLRAGDASFASGAVIQFTFGPNSTPAAVSNSLTIGGKLNVVSGSGFTNTTYTLFTYVSGFLDNGLTIGTTPNPSFTYQIVTTNVGQVNLVVSGSTNGPPTSLPFQVTSIVRQSNDVVITWNTSGASNILQVSTGAGSTGSYSNNYVNLSGSIIVTTPTTNHLDVGGATNLPSRFYRIRSGP